jgi:hypothetical protein
VLRHVFVVRLDCVSVLLQPGLALAPANLLRRGIFRGGRWIVAQGVGRFLEIGVGTKLGGSPGGRPVVGMMASRCVSVTLHLSIVSRPRSQLPPSLWSKRESLGVDVFGARQLVVEAAVELEDGRQGKD